MSFITRTTTHTTVAVTEMPFNNGSQSSCRSSPPARLDVSDRESRPPSSLNSDSDREDSGTPTPLPTSSPTWSSFHTAKSQSMRLLASVSTTSSLTPSSQSQSLYTIPPGDESIIAFYAARYPGRVPHPNQLHGSATKYQTYYVVSRGTSVGIFTDWNIAGKFVLGVKGNKYQGYNHFYRAWCAYWEEWCRKDIRVLSHYQDTAPVETQVQDSGLDLAMDNLTLG
ncbi:hypothetical protein V5O48_010628 [Marasmius crinis-equi]|uniref:Ribonuclease H1 N-terminal domain-containing protein n=1 Tax=Marasmius crinis-equi TaxID=585013 RepID=A0ABR3F8A4_9AGAR